MGWWGAGGGEDTSGDGDDGGGDGDEGSPTTPPRAIPAPHLRGTDATSFFRSGVAGLSKREKRQVKYYRRFLPQGAPGRPSFGPRGRAGEGAGAGAGRAAGPRGGGGVAGPAAGEERRPPAAEPSPLGPAARAAHPIRLFGAFADTDRDDDLAWWQALSDEWGGEDRETAVRWAEERERGRAGGGDGGGRARADAGGDGLVPAADVAAALEGEGFRLWTGGVGHAEWRALKREIGPGEEEGEGGGVA